MFKNRVAWVSDLMPAFKADEGTIVTLAAAVTIFMGFGAIRMMRSGGSPIEDLGGWLPSESVSQAFHSVPGTSEAGPNLFAPEKSGESAPAVGVNDAVSPLVPSKDGGFSPMTDPIVHNFTATGMDSETANGSPGTGAHAQAAAAPAVGRALGPVHSGESRPFVSGRVTHASGASKFGQAAVEGVKGGSNFGGSSTGSSYDSVTGPSLGSVSAGAANLNSTVVGSASSADGTGPASGLGNLQVVGGGGSLDGSNNWPTATDGQIANQRQQLSSDDESLRQNVAIPAVQLLQSMVQQVSDGSDPRTLDVVDVKLENQGLTNSSQFNPTPGAVGSLLASSNTCLQELSQETDLPEDPQGALTCHSEASGALHAYDSWPTVLTGANQPLAAILQTYPAWSFVSAQAGDSASTWEQTTNNVLSDAENMVSWAHTVQLPSWEPAWEQDLDGAIQHLQTAAQTWTALAASSTTDATRGDLLAFGSQETTAGLASLDQALRDMGCNEYNANYGAGTSGTWYGSQGCQ